MAEDLEGVPLFNSVVEQKQAELLLTTQRKLREVNSANVPTLSQRLDNIQREQAGTPVTESLDIPTLEARLKGINQPLVTKDFSPYFSEENQNSGLAYLANIPGSLVGGMGSVGGVMASAPNTVFEILQNTGAGGQLESYFQNNYPQFSNEISQAGIGLHAVTKTLATLGEGGAEGAAMLSNSDETERLVKKVSAAYDDNTGAADVLVGVVNTVVTNPEAIPEIIATSLPMMAALAAEGGILATTFTGMMGQRIGEATATYKETHGGKAPVGEDYNAIAIGAVISTAIETVESKFLLSKAARIKSASKSKIARLGAAPVIATGKRTIGGAAAEGFEEGSAEYITQVTGHSDFTSEGLTSDKVVKPAVVAGAIGAGPGAAIGGGVQILPDIGKVAQKGIQGASVVIDKAVTVNTEKRLKKAVEQKDNLAVVRIGLETDISSFKDTDEQEKYIGYLLDTMDKAFEDVEAMEGTPEERDAAITKVEEVNAKLNTVMDAFIDAKNKETNETTTLSAEQTIQSGDATADDMIAAINTVIEGADQGAAIQENTVESIKGSTEFDSLTPEQKDTIELVDEAIQTEKAARKINPNKTLGDVAKDIASGNTQERFIGLAQHRKNVAAAIQLKNKGRAAKSLKQLVALRQAILTKLANPAVDPATGKQYKQGVHAPAFVKQLSAEVEAITATLNLLDSNVTKAFGESPLTAQEQTSPTIEVFGGEAARKPTTETTPKPTPTPKPESKPEPEVEEEVEIKVEKSVVTPASEIDETTNIDNVEIPTKSSYVAKVLQKKIKKGSFVATKSYKAAIVEADNVLRAVQEITRECRI